MQEGLRILSSNITNFKNITHKEIDLGGKSILVVGPNNKGKSSFIQALMTPLNSNYKPLKPVKEGEDRASIEVVIGGIVKGVEKKYTVEMYFSPDNQKGRLVLLDEEGQKIPSPASALDSIIGNISFDIDEFIALSKTRSGTFSKEGALKQIEILKGFLPKETRDELMQCDFKIKELKDLRADMNKTIKELSEKVKHEYSDEELVTYSTPIPIEPIQEKLKNIGEASQKHAAALAAEKKLTDSIAATKKDIASKITVENAKFNLEVLTNLFDSLKQADSQLIVTFLVHAEKLRSELNHIVGLSNSLPVLESDLAKTKKWLEKNEAPKSQEIIDELNDANEHNEHYKKVEELKKMFKSADNKKTEFEEHAKTIKTLQERKREIFASNPLPVKNLSFDEEQVLYKGLPFNEEQHPSSIIIGVGVMIAMKMNPNLKVIVIKDGSLLDNDTANAVLAMVNKYGYQLIIEMVSRDGSDMSIEFIEKFV